jgi:hypothetical protein
MKTRKNQLVVGGIAVLILIICIALYVAIKPQYYEYNGQKYGVGESFKDKEGCNTCSFNKNGELQCTMMACYPDQQPQDKKAVDLQFTYNNSEYTYTGTVQTPTPCYDVKTETVIRESYPEQADLRFTTTDSGENCIDVIDNKLVSGEIKVSENAIIMVYLDNTLQPGVGVNL